MPGQALHSPTEDAARAGSLLLQAARQAPSGDNTQPWRFWCSSANREILIALDEVRDRSPMNAGQRMARIALGAAGENVEVAARNGRCEAEVVPASQSEGLAVRFDHFASSEIELPAELTQRMSNRRVYGGQNADVGQLQLPRNGSWSLTNARVIWLSDRTNLEQMAKLIGHSDAMMFGLGAIRRAFLENVRFDRPASEAVEEGLSLDSLELAAGERSGLAMLGKIPDWLFSIGGIARSFRTKSQKLVQSSSALCVIAARSNEGETDFLVGRLMQRAWLELTRQNFAVQPMMSLPVLEGMVTHSHTGCTKALSQKTAELSGEMKRLAGLADGERIAAILRFGIAPPPSGRTGRRPLESMIQPVGE